MSACTMPDACEVAWAVEKMTRAGATRRGRFPAKHRTTHRSYHTPITAPRHRVLHGTDLNAQRPSHQPRMDVGVAQHASPDCHRTQVLAVKHSACLSGIEHK